MTAPRRRSLAVVDPDEAPLPDVVPTDEPEPEAPPLREAYHLGTPVVTTFGALARAVHETFYPAIHSNDKQGVKRVGRATARLLDRLS